MGAVFLLAKGTTFLMPGPLTSAHGAIKACNTCHTKSGEGQLSWVHGLVAGDPLADSKACIACHKMPDTAFNAHSASAEALKQSTDRLTKIAAQTPQPASARAQNIAFPTHNILARDVYCATCHQEHQGVNFNLNKISNEQCRSCHVVKFDSFDGDHPKFDGYPFKKRTPIIYDHAGHFGKHYPEVAKKEPAKRIPATCSTCHDSRDDKRVMAVTPFEQTCSTCHLNQIIGKERASGPKGVAFLTLPGLDLQTLKTKNAAIGEWPDASDAALTPFMRVMISRTERGRAVLKTIEGVNLQDLSNAGDNQIKAATNLAWEIKSLLHALISGKASDVLGDLNIGGGAKLSAALVADLTASIPRDVVIGAQQQWLPNLAAEIANGPGARSQPPGGANPATTESSSNGAPNSGGSSGAETAVGSDAGDPQQGGSNTQTTEPTSDASASSEEPSDSGDGSSTEVGEGVKRAKLDPPACVVRVFGQCLVTQGQSNPAGAAKPDGAAAPTDAANADADSGKQTPKANSLPGKMNAGAKHAEAAAEPEGAAANADTGKGAPSASEPPQNKAANQSDELLFPTDEELRAIKAAQPAAASRKDNPANAAPTQIPSPDAPSGGGADGPLDAAARPQTGAAPVISIDSDVDPESWAEYGGWYRQDYAIYYRPIGHKDKFIYSWLFLTGPQAPKGDPSPAAAVFDVLTNKDAQGSCTKCHSIDDIPGKGRVVNFSPTSVESKQGRFTRFIHEPHFGIMEDRGCLTCHSLEKGRPYLKSYEQSNPQSFATEFGGVKKDLCQSCHTSSKARQDCLTCHDYHVNGVVTPITTTKLPTD
ncbi:MAG: hypothetical protein ACT4OU_09020 [Hyphomicrobium sp.]